MVNIQHEDTLINNFLLLSRQYCIKNIHIEKDKKSNHMDCEFTLKNKEYIRVEAKTFKDSRNYSQNFIKIFGGILKGRNLPLAYSKNNYPVYYGIMIDLEDFEKFKRYKQTINNIDWLNFSRNYDAKYIFVVSKNKIFIYDWDEIEIQ
ncbi:hypothetical protein [uncultured Exiguobacterium sp.]|uniref:hypothetical protein n=1 Tax=uncultured Exiguobacterium sp. TaxID=202669 RepID=UPI0025E8A3CC|nr:hypothetical protein [uncultured Exiguobacterium sp.]